MLRFFHQVRQGLLFTGKTSKYIKYAIGEIVLVMIGILLALQVNNWNENRKQKVQELKLASQLLDDARADSIFFLTRVGFQQQRDTLFNNLLNLNNKSIGDSIRKIKSNYGDNGLNPFFFRLAYQSNLINNNPNAYDMISDSEIKDLLRSYKMRYDYVVHAIELANRITEEYGNPLKIKYYSQLINFNNDTPLGEFNSMMESDETKAVINMFKGYGANSYIQLKNFMTVNQELIKILDSYLVSNSFR